MNFTIGLKLILHINFPYEVRQVRCCLNQVDGWAVSGNEAPLRDFGGSSHIGYSLLVTY